VTRVVGRFGYACLCDDPVTIELFPFKADALAKAWAQGTRNPRIAPFLVEHANCMLFLVDQLGTYYDPVRLCRHLNIEITAPRRTFERAADIARGEGT
jgi:hypothetical protein